MTRKLVVWCLLLTAALVAPASSDTIVGGWIANSSTKHPERLEFLLQLPPRDQNGTQFDRSAFTGLTDVQIESEARVPVQFDLRREAGTIAFDGTFRNGRGSGDFTFTPSSGYAQKLGALGVDFEPKKDDQMRELFALTIFDVSTEFIRSMQKIGYREPLEIYEQFRIFGVDPQYVQEMAKIGFKDLPAEKLVETKIHGATPDYIREMRAAGKNLTLDDYIQDRIFQVTPEFSTTMANAGYPNLDHDTLVQFKIHGVTPEFIQEIRKAGYSRLPAEKLVEMRIHGVTPEFIRRVEKAGYHNVPIDKLVQMRIFDIDPEMVRALDDDQKTKRQSQ